MTSGIRASILIPTRNESAEIADCLASIARQSIPPSELEVVVVDGNSSDATAHVASTWLREHEFASSRVLSNDEATTPSNLNLGLTAVSGPIVCRVDARSRIPPDYVARCIETLEQDRSLAVVGGAQMALARGPSSRAVGIARALNNRWGMGLSRYRRGAGSGKTDTVYLGSFWTEDLRAVGGWDERLPTNQDFDLNQRLSSRGDVWFCQDLGVGYLPRSSIIELWRQYHRFGTWKARYWRLTGTRPQARQLVIMIGPPVLAVGGLAVLTRRRWRLPVALAIATGAGVVEHAGSQGPTGGPAARLWSITAMSAVAVGWLAGVWRGLLDCGR